MIPASVVADARAAQAQTGASDTAAALALAVAGPESGYNPNAVGDSGSSFGLTQLHTNANGDGGGLGNGYSVSQLLDPVKNLAIAMGHIQGQLDNGATPLESIGAWSTRNTAIGALNEALEALGAAPLAGGSGSGSGINGETGLPSKGAVALGIGLLAIIWLIGD